MSEQSESDVDGARHESAAATAVGIRAVLRVRPFRKLWTALALSSFGDWLGLLSQIGLAAALGEQHGYATQNFAVGGVVFMRLLPAATLAPLAGAVADKFDRRLTMVTADVIRCGLFISIPLVRELWWLAVATFLIETMSLFWIPAKEATVPNLVSRKQLESANQLSLLTTYGSAPVAAAVFAVLALVTGVLAQAIPFLTANPVDLAIYFNAATFLFAAVTVASMRADISHPRRRKSGGTIEVGPDGAVSADSADGGHEPSLWRAIIEGWRFIGQTKIIRGLVIGMFGAFAAAGVVVGISRIYVHDLGGGNPGFGLLFGAVFVGLATGMFAGPRLLRGLSRRRLFSMCIVAAGVSLAITALIHNLPIVVAGTFVLGWFAGISWVTGYTLFGLEVEDHLRGRTWAALQSLMQVTLMFMVVAGPIISGAIGVHALHISHVLIRFNGSAITMLGAGLIAVVLGVFAYRQMDDRDEPLWRDVWAALRRQEMPTGRGVTTGLFVALEGGEGAGKSTQAALLSEWLTAQGHEVVCTFEPGATPAGARLRELLLDPATGDLSARSEALLYAADRAEHVSVVIRPALARGAVVICDRYVDSTLAYQGAGRTLSAEELARISRWATSGLRPDLTVLLDIPPAVGLSRGKTFDRLEAQPIDFHMRVRDAFRQLADGDPDRYLVLDAQARPDIVQRRIRERLGPILAPTERHRGAVVTQ